MIEFKVEFTFKEKEDEDYFCKDIEYQCDSIRIALVQWFEDYGLLTYRDKVVVSLVSEDEGLES